MTQTRRFSQSGPAYPVPDDLASCVAGLTNTLAKGTADLMTAYDLVPMEFALLRLFMASDEWTTTELAQALPVKMARISRIVTKVVDKGLMHRRRPPDDRRVVKLALTDEGKELALEIHGLVQAYIGRLSEGVSEQEMAAFISTTSKVMANYAATAQAHSSDRSLS